MIRITPDISHKFKCSSCDGLLSAKPINAGPNNSQICALCYEVLSDEDKEKYVHQTVFERIAELFIFPCRYKNNGCKFEYIFSQNVEHERKCRYKCDKARGKELTIGNRPEVDGKGNYICENKASAFESVCVASKEINLEVDFQTCDNFYINRIGTHHLKYSFRVQGKDGYHLCLKNPETHTKINYAKIIGEGVLSLEIPVHSVQHSLEVKSVVADIPRKLCSICQDPIEDNVYHCLFGHNACKDCKGKTCTLCEKVIMGEPKSHCRNRHKGCTVLENVEFLLKHEIDCEFNDFKCPFPRCVFLNSLPDLKFHVTTSHKNNLIKCNHISETLYGRRDKKWYTFYSDNLFVCKYFYFVTSFEFIVQYVGANDNAKLFQFEVDIKSKKRGNFRKRSNCAGWNEMSLCRGISYECDDIADWTDWENSKFTFTIDLKIMHNNNTSITTL